MSSLLIVFCFKAQKNDSAYQVKEILCATLWVKCHRLLRRTLLLGSIMQLGKGFAKFKTYKCGTQQSLIVAMQPGQ